MIDYAESKYSTFFNLGAPSILQYTGPCPIYRRNATSLVLFESLAIKSDGTVEVGMQSTNYGCLSATDLAGASAKINELTNVTGGAMTIGIGNLQIFSLSLV